MVAVQMMKPGVRVRLQSALANGHRIRGRAEAMTAQLKGKKAQD